MATAAAHGIAVVEPTKRNSDVKIPTAHIDNEGANRPIPANAVKNVGDKKQEEAEGSPNLPDTAVKNAGDKKQEEAEGSPSGAGSANGQPLREKAEGGKETSVGTPPFAPYGLAELEADAQNVQEVQETVLQKTLKLHENTEYLQKYGIDGSTSPEEFRRRHPVTRYEHYAEYIEREAAGESRETGKQILCAEPIMGYMLTSGSSKGTQKKIPMTAGAAASNAMTMTLFRDIFKRTLGDAPQVVLTFIHVGRELPLPGGLTASSGTTLGLRLALKSFENSEVARISLSPKEVFETTDARQAMYCHLLCALAGRERITALRSNFLIHVVAGVRFMVKHWESFVHDLRTGTVNPEFVRDDALRTAVQNRVPAQPENASALEAEFRRGSDGILPRVFPAVKSIQAVCTGSMLQYVPVAEKYAGPDVTLLSPAYIASEPATIGFCLHPECHPRDVAYTIMPRPVYWEFIPVDEPEGEQPVTKLLHELEEGKSYELVLTNASGLYRYRLEDVVRVTGFLHGLPQVQYEYRRGTLTITAKSEKVTEKDLAVAVGAMEERIPADGGRILDYTVAIDTEADPERYTLFVELDGNEEVVTEQTLAACAEAFDTSLQSNPDYVQYRLREQIGLAEICLVKKGTFDAFKDYKIRKGTDTAQFKMPRCLKTPEQQAVFCKGLLRSSAGDCQWFNVNLL